MDKLDKQLQYSLAGDFNNGWKLVQELEKERPECHRCAFNRGWYLLQQGKFQEGFELLNRGRWVNVFGSPALNISNKPIFNLSSDDINGKVILIRNEGGFGDEILNIRFVTKLAKAGAEIIVSCRKGLHNLMMRVEGVRAVLPPEYESRVRFDYWAPAMSLPYLTQNTYETLSGKSYITADPDLVTDAKQIFSEETGMKIGIRWTGNQKFEHEQYRKFPPQLMVDLIKNRNANFYSLEIDNPPLMGSQDLRPALVDWDHTAAVISNLDLVITSCTSVAHMAGALGVPVWIIVPILPYYSWALPGNKTPWYDSVRLFRQSKQYSWDEPFEEISGALNTALLNFRNKDGNKV